MWNDHLGFISASPANLGTGLRVAVRVRLPKLSSNATQFKTLVNGMCLKEHYIDNDIVEIRHSVRLGKSEAEIINAVVDGVHKLVQLETEL